MTITIKGEGRNEKVNFIVQRLISEPSTIKALFENLPEKAKAHVASLTREERVVKAVLKQIIETSSKSPKIKNYAGTHQNTQDN